MTIDLEALRSKIDGEIIEAAWSNFPSPYEIDMEDGDAIRQLIAAVLVASGLPDALDEIEALRNALEGAWDAIKGAGPLQHELLSAAQLIEGEWPGWAQSCRHASEMLNGVVDALSTARAALKGD